MKTFTRIEPTTVYEVGDRFKQQVVVKRFRTEDVMAILLAHDVLTELQKELRG